MLSILLIAAGAILETLFIMQSYRRRDVASIILKTTASLLFVLLGIHCTRLRGQSVYALYVVIGLALGMLGDLLLALRYLSKKTHDLCFVSGTLAFFAGHVLYILAVAHCRAARLDLCHSDHARRAGCRGLLFPCNGGQGWEDHAARRDLYRVCDLRRGLFADRRAADE